MKILITGGHLTPALSFIDWLKEHQPTEKVVFVGREFSQDLLRQESVEKYELEKRQIKFIPFSAVRLGKNFLVNFFKEIWRFFVTVKAAKKILATEKVTVFLSFGGYLAVPFALAAFLSRIPVVTHEQTLTVGFANKLIGWLASQVAVSFPETAQNFSAKKVTVTGNLLRKGVFAKQQKQPAWFNTTDLPILLVMGGNQGAKVLNELVLANLEELSKAWVVVQQCGKPTSERDYKQVFTMAISHLPLEQQKNVYVKEWLDEKDLFWFYRHAKAALSRSGANATQEIVVTGLPTIFVPLPISHQNEQYKNAKWLVDQGAAILVEQSALTKEKLFESLAKVVAHQDSIKENLAKIEFNQQAPQQVYELVKKVANREN